MVLLLVVLLLLLVDPLAFRRLLRPLPVLAVPRSFGVVISAAATLNAAAAAAAACERVTELGAGVCASDNGVAMDVDMEVADIGTGGGIPHAPSASALPSAAVLPATVSPLRTATGVRFLEEDEAEKEAEAEDGWA